MLVCCVLLQSYLAVGRTKVSSDTLALYKNDYPQRGYRSILDFGAFAGDNNLSYSISNIHGAQIFPQLFVGLGGMYSFCNLGDEFYREAAFLDVRYDALKKKSDSICGC